MGAGASVQSPGKVLRVGGVGGKLPEVGGGGIGGGAGAMIDDSGGNPRPKARRRQGPASSSGKNTSGSGTESHGGSFPVTDDIKTILYSSFPQGASSSDRADFGGEEESSSASSMRSHSTSKNRQLYSTGLSDFLSKHVLGDKDSFASFTPSFQRKSEAATLAMKMAMDHFMFEGTHSIVRQMFIQELEEEHFKKDDAVCNEGDPGDKLYIVESGTISFMIGGVPVGEQKCGGVFGELSLVYGIERSASAVCMTDCVLWSLDLVGFRRIQSCLAMEALENSYRSAQRTLSTLTKEEITQSLWERSDFKLENLTKVAVLGQGTFGCVYLVKDEVRKSHFALKQLSKANLVKAKQGLRAVAERNVLRACSSDFVLKLYETFSDSNCLYFLTDFVQGGDLMSYMIEQGTLNNDVATFLAACMTEAIKHIHSKGFVHRDIKPENCLVTTKGYLKVADLGLAKRLPAVVEVGRGRTEISLLAFTMCGTPEFMAPEFCMSVGYDHSADWWAFGCVMFEMYMGRNPFDTGGNLKQTFKEVCMIGMGKGQLSLHPKFEEKFPEAANLLLACLSPASNRIGKASSPNAHPYFKTIDFEKLREGEIEAPYVPVVQGETDMFYFEKGLAGVEDDLKVYEGDNEWCNDF
ncbi:hypothetical protein TrST_g13869 [Triparma strigata]|uniref:cGMP-dependent protein kinase n=1 Tax=Triparma strigata TaxID=1606541 RepID=A0A9W7AXJ0_9STRA|nr:hypothetical protein TrST_g13869 [Triparma strigata]